MPKVPKEIIELVQRFERNIDSYRNPAYNETQLRSEFINPFFEALGWDVTNKAGYAEAYKDVIHEDAIKVGGVTKAPDYCFRIGGTRKFFLESKKPAISIKEDINPAYQLRRYAWSAKLPVSILTDFEEFAVYDCRIRPQQKDRASKARILYVTCKEYVSRWKEIASIFTKDAVLLGSFDKFVISSKGKRGTSEVDSEFLNEIENWREALARNLALRNKKLTIRELNFSVQLTIDRIIFLRMCEDRGIEEYGQLQALLNGENTYGRLRYIYGLADARYNSGLFHFRKEKDRPEPPDELTPTLKIDDKILKDIIRRLYYPESPYEFSVLGADILGNVYEQFLGKVIRLTPKHQAVVEQKPEVKKAGGVYYTPSYIVDYIVKNTVGELCEAKTPRQISNLRILDPACGSGSFLLGAYTFLLNFHRDWYLNNNPPKQTKAIYQGSGGDWHLTTQEKKRILLNNIYGVDIDSQAVEVTKLSLLLKVLEGESQDTLNRQLKMWRERALPDLSHNIKCGNSLIGPEFYENHQLNLIEEEAHYRINAFDWTVEFPKIMECGGFDTVIGNPPYIRIQAMKQWAPLEVETYKELFRSASRGNYDIYVIFVEKGLQLLNQNGILGFILPHKFFQSEYGVELRKLIAEGKNLTNVIHFGHHQVFSGSTTYTCLLFLSRRGAKQVTFQKVLDLEIWRNIQSSLSPFTATDGSPTVCVETATFPTKALTASEWHFAAGQGAGVFEKLKAMNTKLGDVANIFVGLQTSADDVFILQFIKETKSMLRLYSKALGLDMEFEKDLFFPLVSGTDVNRYAPLEERQYILFPYKVQNKTVNLIRFKDIKDRFPKTAAYLEKNRNRLEARENWKFKDPNWHRFGRNQNIGIQGQIKLCVPRLVDRLYASFDQTGNYYLDNVDVGGVTLKSEYSHLEYTYLLALLNSKLLRWYFPFVSVPFRGGWFSANRQFLSLLPVRLINFSDSGDRAFHEKLTTLAGHMLELHNKLTKTRTPAERARIQRQINSTDTKIDSITYELYDLTEREITIVEEETKN